MSGELWALVGGVAVICAVLRAAGPVLLGDRDLPPWSARVVALLAPALLAALVATQALADGDELYVGERTAGVGAAGLVFWRGGSVLSGVAVATGVTAALRALT